MFKFNEKYVNRNDFIGRGGAGYVYGYQQKENDDRWVVKEMFAKSLEQLEQIFEEIVLGFSADHPSILPLRGYLYKI